MPSFRELYDLHAGHDFPPIIRQILNIKKYFFYKKTLDPLQMEELRKEIYRDGFNDAIEWFTLLYSTRANLERIDYEIKLKKLAKEDNEKIHLEDLKREKERIQKINEEERRKEAEKAYKEAREKERAIYIEELNRKCELAIDLEWVPSFEWIESNAESFFYMGDGKGYIGGCGNAFSRQNIIVDLYRIGILYAKSDIYVFTDLTHPNKIDRTIYVHWDYKQHEREEDFYLSDKFKLGKQLVETGRAKQKHKSIPEEPANEEEMRKCKVQRHKNRLDREENKKRKQDIKLITRNIPEYYENESHIPKRKIKRKMGIIEVNDEDIQNIF